MVYKVKEKKGFLWYNYEDVIDEKVNKEHINEWLSKGHIYYESESKVKISKEKERELKKSAPGKKTSLDFNGDGKFDEKDVSLAGKALAKARKKKKSKRGNR